MLKKENSSNNWAKVCDTCRSTACTVYCRADSAYLCAGCDARIHAANLVASRHERVWVCEACERAPAAFLCKADAASLCASCDADIHSANPLARRHHRVPIMPIPGTLYGPPAVDTLSGGTLMIGGPEGDATEDDGFLSLTQDADDTTIDEEDKDEAASWLLLNLPVKNNNKNINNNNNNQNNYGMLFGGEVVDEYLDLAEYGGDSQFNDQYSVNQQQQNYSVPQKNYGGDSVVPVQDRQGKSMILYQQQQQQQQQHNHHLSFQLGMEYDNSNTGYGYPASMSHSVSISSIDVSVVPESALSETSNSHPRLPKGTIDLFSGPPIQMPTQLTPMDREARVLRYREKKKNRKFEKTIRYASRKAYAETRPRIKGRFAKRTDVEAEVDQMFSTQLIADSSYGIVPSF
ncbi:zinc finger protein CONSTANS-LIKE 2 [Nicotiana tomentosiformis]|uniref:zinc finger protein CONSTANS-LIKE 2 n=1 Tax=Nicotiana tomentosiformis TaxID=4098 RepID=UPI00051C15B5|nr:zinc finger protein CONSTANS-LIKE 2 [Nicotiana tomentosiformis]WTM05068.1 CONSTANS-like B-box zinc-finger transcription factor 2 [Nicotiana tomentosiformis]WTM05072.1 CONSTANS-like B-box zinc-finger transcription factor 2 [Nicotiana tomentosiformis]